MSRKRTNNQAADAATTQEAPTQPRPRDAQGRELDEWGLPLNGPARVAALEALGKPDPNVEPDAWGAGGDNQDAGNQGDDNQGAAEPADAEVTENGDG